MKKIIALITVLASASASAWWDSDSGYYNSDAYGRGYGYGDGYGNGRGDASGSADMDSEFTMTFRGRARGDAQTDWDADYRGYYNGYGNFDGRGYSYNNSYPYYGYAPYYYGYPAPHYAPAQPPKGPADDDKDGVINTSDLCPDTAAGATVDVLGCAKEARIVLRGVNFKTDSDELTDESLSILDGVSRTLAANPQLKILVAGHTDADGDDAYNKDLSQRRAQSVVNYLVGKNVDANNLIAKGYGEEQPIAGNDTVEGKAQNRRVELNRL